MTGTSTAATVARTSEMPWTRSQLLSGLSVIAILLTVSLGQDPYLDLGVKPYATGVIAIVAAQALCAIAVVAFFAKDRRDHSAARVIVAPALGAAGLVAGVYLIATNFSVISGFTGLTNTILLALPPIAFVIGVVGYGLTKPPIEEQFRHPIN
jgi:hypothetical protein